MTKHNASNERIKRKYFGYLREARRHSPASVDAVAKALSRFDELNRYRDYRQFHREQAVAFKRKLAEQQNLRTGERLSKATLHSTLQALRSFFFWLAGQPGFKSKISYSDADYFNLTDKEVREAAVEREQLVPALEQIHHVLTIMPSGTDIERRNRALIALALLTGARDGAMASLRLKHVNLERGLLIQDPREVRTKSSKSMTTFFFPVGGEALAIVTDWIRHLRATLLRGDDDPLFPATKVALGPDRRFGPVGLSRNGWSNATPIRKIFAAAFAEAQLPYFNPHSFRKTLALLGERLCKSPEEFKVWSQNLGHEHVLTTLTSYGTVSQTRQGEVMKRLGATSTDEDDPRELAARLASLLSST